VREVIAAIPPPLPIGLYFTVMPVAESNAGIHWETSGKTNELPAPSRVVATAAVGFALEAPAANAAATVAARRARPRSAALVTGTCDSGMELLLFSSERFATTLWSTPAPVGGGAVFIWRRSGEAAHRPVHLIDTRCSQLRAPDRPLRPEHSGRPERRKDLT